MGTLTKQNDGAANTQDEIFALAYIKTFDPAAAWLEATGGEKKYATQNGHKWLKKPVIRARLQELAKDKIDQHNANADRLIAELERIAFLDPAEFMTIDGSGEPVLDLTTMTPENRRLLDIEFGIGVTKDGDRVRTYKVKSHDKMEAIEKLLKLHQLYKGEDLTKQPVAIQVNVNFPVPGQHWQQNGPASGNDIDAEHESV